MLPSHGDSVIQANPVIIPASYINNCKFVFLFILCECKFNVDFLK